MTTDIWSTMVSWKLWCNLLNALSWKWQDDLDKTFACNTLILFSSAFVWNLLRIMRPSSSILCINITCVKLKWSSISSHMSAWWKYGGTVRINVGWTLWKRGIIMCMWNRGDHDVTSVTHNARHIHALRSGLSNSWTNWQSKLIN